MYAIIRAGGKQAKVQSGDVIEIERVKGDADEMSFSPLSSWTTREMRCRIVISCPRHR